MDGNVKFISNNTLSGFSYIFPSDINPNDRFREFLLSEENCEYLEIKNALFEVKRSDKSNQDAWHLYCVERLKLDHFLTCDTALLGLIKSIKNLELRRKLLKTVVLPKDLCGIMGLDGASEADINYLFKLLSGWR
jgi:hypothetical protein